MSRFWNDRVRSLSPYVPGEQPKDKRYIKLNTNENPYPPSPKTLEAIQRAANGDLRLYPDPTAQGLRQVIAERYGTSVDRVFVGNGSDEILAFAFAAFFGSRRSSDASDSPVLPLLFPDITYSFYPVYAQLWKVPCQTVPLMDDFSLRFRDYLVPCGGVVFPNPNAPTGRALDVEEVLSIVEYQEKRSTVVLVDEAYVDFGAQSARSAVSRYANLLTVHTLSKASSLAGLRVGFAIGQEELIEGLRRIRDSFNSYTLDRLALAGAEAALSDGAYYDEVNRRLVRTRDRSAEALRRLGFIVVPSLANFLFVRHPKREGAELFQILRDRGILVRYFKKERIDQYLRISVGTDEEMDTLLRVCEELV